MAEPDELFTLKNQLWVGNYQDALSEGAMLNQLSESLRNERDVVSTSVPAAHDSLHTMSLWSSLVEMEV
ncbi:hypothetical protein PHYPSEUDO_003164 [Phytophthora pseudosyringae]|uniref:Uncharacterized protein n=1 Tax=Phytophthora pseudosyringae TaxID=221518 RepID=A0A8T1VRM3_9STRA|nr:hypothetical protein PHYPSEUDO_003164 [Phytophthora pseudosyringae]